MQPLEFVATDPGHFEDSMRPVSGDVSARPAKGTVFDARVKMYRLGRLALFTVKAPSIRVCIPPSGIYSLTVPLGRPFSVWEEGHRSEIGNSQAHIIRADIPFDLSTNTGCSVLAANVRGPDLQASVAKLNQSESSQSQSPSLDYVIDFKNPEGNELFRCLAEIWGVIKRDDATTGSPIGLQELEDEYLTKFILAAQTDPGSFCKSVSTIAISRVEEFLIAHLSEPVSRADLAEIAGVSIRSLSRGFAQRHGVGPMKFLRKRRLEASYRELLGSDRHSTTVTDVALRCGFNHLGKYAIEYRQVFGEHPSETLAR